MRSKYVLGITASLLVAVGGCSDDEEVVGSTVDGTYVAPVSDFDAVSETAMWYDGAYDPVTGVFIGQITPTGDGGLLGDAGVAALNRLVPRPLSGLFGAWHVILRADCIPMVPITDVDLDGVPASYTATFNCQGQTTNQTSSVTGSITITDADDNAKLAGLTITYTNFVVTTVIDGATRTRTVNGGTALAPTATGALQSSNNLTIGFDFTSASNVHTTGTWTAQGQGTYTPDPSVGNDVFSMGTVNLSGQGTLQRTIDNVMQSRTITRQTNPNLHWNRACRTQNRDSLGYDSGTLLYQDNQASKLQVNFNNGCGNPTVKVD